MKLLNLAGDWLLSFDGASPVSGRLPGCTYLDLMANGMPNPFWGENETKASEIAHHDYQYSRVFTLNAEMLKAEHLDLVADGLDTLCTIVINGREAGKANNISRVWRLDIKELCREGENSIELQFADPYAAVEAMQKADPLTGPMIPEAGVGHIRKAPCHFSWDWGPKLPPAGVARGIGLEAYSLRVEDVRIRQEHKAGAVCLLICAALTATDGVEGTLSVTDPDGKTSSHTATVEDKSLCWEIPIENPQLWWCNGLGGQPLYRLDASVTQNGVEIDSFSRQIGLRTLELDTSPDVHGHQFRFVINGVPIFAKGANWIPPDSFITRADRATMDFYVEAAKHAGMNMLRVWGGGMFENEDFYDACDCNGILVWQDFLFACNAYPLYDAAFLENVRAETEDNVRRIRHRASLALWCGNNENEIFLIIAKSDIRIRESNLKFYHETLRDWVAELDGVTPYWPGSPSSGSRDHKVHNMQAGQIRGDTHLWNIWHGMRAIEAFRSYPTRFCSEYGMESMPSMHTIRSFTDEAEPDLFDPVMLLHQKCKSGNEKMLYYLLAKYRNPARFEDFVYLSQIVQANTVRFATDCWRRNFGKQNGALFWQLNDCWPVASWAGIDYEKQYKAVMYQARHFNKMLCLSNDYFKNRAEIYVENDYPHAFAGQLEWTLTDFEGKKINGGVCDIKVDAVASKKIAVLRYGDILNGHKKQKAVLEVRLINGGEAVDKKMWLLVPDKNAALPKASVTHSVSQSGDTAVVSLSSDSYARYVYVEAEGVTAPWSDNFFDIPAGGSVELRVKLPEGMSAETLAQRLKIKTLTDVEPKNSRLKDKWLRVAMMMKKKNWYSWILFKIRAG